MGGPIGHAKNILDKNVIAKFRQEIYLKHIIPKMTLIQAICTKSDTLPLTNGLLN